MAYAARSQMHTVYNVMAAKGVFAKNPANADSQAEDGTRLYSGPVQYPQMLYHPLGTEREASPGEWIDTPNGPKLVGRHTELIWKIAKTEAEGNELRSLGWHDHPAKAIAASGKEAPAMGAGSQIQSQEQEIARLQAQIEEMKSKMGERPAAASPLGASAAPAKPVPTKPSGPLQMPKGLVADSDSE